jgi:hypothetical protein
MGVIATTIVHLDGVKKCNGRKTRQVVANCVQFGPKSSNRISRPARSTALPPLRERLCGLIFALAGRWARWIEQSPLVRRSRAKAARSMLKMAK